MRIQAKASAWLGVALLAVGLAAGAGTLRSGEAAQSLFEAILRKHSRFKDFQARFTETPISRAAGAGAEESGVLFYRRPSQWRWEYHTPERKIVIVRGREAAILIEGDPDISRYDLAGEDREGGVGALLAGGEALGRAFVASFEPAGGAEEPVLRLDPVQLSDEYDHVFLRVRRRDLEIREVVIVDPGGNRLRFQFEAFRTDLGLPESLFTLSASPAELAGTP